MAIENPIIVKIDDNKEALQKLYDSLGSSGKKDKFIKDYPIVYIHNWKNNDKYETYVGESNNFYQRTIQHFREIENQKSWQKSLKEHNASLYIIGHPEFNKSLTLDVENRLIHYLTGSDNVRTVHNARSNPQNEYYTCEDFDKIFSKIWRKLREFDKSLFLLENEVKDSAIYKASPLHKLSLKQNLAKKQILDKIELSLLNDNNCINNQCQLIWVQGDAGTGKTVLMSSLFYELVNSREELDLNEKIDVAMIVNNDEQLTVYKEITKKLDLVSDNETVVFNPTQFINCFLNKKNSPRKREKLYDVVFVDEAHLLLTQKNQAFTGEHGQLVEIMKYAKTVVVMFDKIQIMNAEQYLSDDTIDNYVKVAKSQNNYIELDEQMRMNANPQVMHWLRRFYLDGILEPLTKKRGKYEIKIFDSPDKLEKAIEKKAKNSNTKLSRLIATYDWPYSSASTPKDELYWSVKIGNWVKPWNKEIKRHFTKNENLKIRGLSWAEQPQTIDEVGSIYTIHGFDLNYAGVILGPSIKFRNNRVVFDHSSSCNDKATRKRTLEDGTKKSFGKIFLRNELGLLLTRGVNGLYIYACDKELRDQLKKCI